MTPPANGNSKRNWMLVALIAPFLAAVITYLVAVQSAGARYPTRTEFDRESQVNAAQHQEIRQELREGQDRIEDQLREIRGLLLRRSSGNGGG